MNRATPRQPALGVITVKQKMSMIAFALLIAFAGRAEQDRSPVYKVTEIRPLPGTDHAVANAINDRGQVVGYCYKSSGSGHVIIPIPFIWEEGKMVTLRAISGQYGWATDINERGDIVGFADKDVRTGLGIDEYTAASLPTMWVAWAKFQADDWRDQIPLRLPGDDAQELKINNRRQVIVHGRPRKGSSENSLRAWRAVETKDKDGDIVGRMEAYNIPLPKQYVSGTFWPVDINDHGDIIGNGGQIVAVFGSRAVFDDGRGFVYKDGQWTELASSTTTDSGNSECRGLNNRGDIVGWTTRAGNRRATRWSDGIPHALSTSWGSSSEAIGVNDSGVIVGEVKGPKGETHAWLWTVHGQWDLNSRLPKKSGWILSGATSINNRGQIIGGGAYKGNAYASYILTPK